MNRKQQGYTLIEVMLVIIMVTTLSLSGMYGWQRWQQKQHLWQSAVLLRVWLQQLRDDANWHNRDHRLSVRVTPDGACLVSDQSRNAGCQSTDAWHFVPPWSDISPDEITEGMGFFGLRNTAWPGHLTLRGEAGRYRAVISTWGRVRLCRENEGTSCE